MNKFSKLEMAKALATYAHNGQVDKAGIPYINHPLVVASNFEDEDLKIIALLHDVVEDTFVTLETIENLFGLKISEVIKALTRLDNEDYDEYIKRVATNQMALKIKLADLRHNMDLSRIKDVSERDLARIEKYKNAKAYLEKKIEVEDEK